MSQCFWSASERGEALGDQDTRICARKDVDASQPFLARNCVVAHRLSLQQRKGLGAMSKCSLSKASAGAKENTKRPAEASASGGSPYKVPKVSETD